MFRVASGGCSKLVACSVQASGTNITRVIESVWGRNGLWRSNSFVQPHVRYGNFQGRQRISFYAPCLRAPILVSTCDFYALCFLLRFLYYVKNENDRLFRLDLDRCMWAVVSGIVKICRVVCVLIRRLKSFEPHGIWFRTCSTWVRELSTNYFFGIWPLGPCRCLQVPTFPVPGLCFSCFWL